MGDLYALPVLEIEHINVPVVWLSPPGISDILLVGAVPEVITAHITAFAYGVDFPEFFCGEGQFHQFLLYQSFGINFSGKQDFSAVRRKALYVRNTQRLFAAEDYLPVGAIPVDKVNCPLPAFFICIECVSNLIAVRRPHCSPGHLTWST